MKCVQSAIETPDSRWGTECTWNKLPAYIHPFVLWMWLDVRLLWIGFWLRDCFTQLASCVCSCINLFFTDVVQCNCFFCKILWKSVQLYLSERYKERPWFQKAFIKTSVKKWYLIVILQQFTILNPCQPIPRHWFVHLKKEKKNFDLWYEYLFFICNMVTHSMFKNSSL